MFKTLCIFLPFFIVFPCSLEESVNRGSLAPDQGFEKTAAKNTAAEKGAAAGKTADDDGTVTEDRTVEEAPGPVYLTLVATGDNLFHNVMIRPHPETGAYDFTGYYAAIKPFIEPADIAFINQETLLAGAVYGFSGYPRFNTPQEAGAALVDAGFDVVNHATNHIMDKGEGAVFATMDYWDSIPQVQYLGIHRSQENRDSKKVIIEKNGVKAGFLAYTYGTNGLAVPKDKPYLVSLTSEAAMEREINALRPLCDFLVVSMHWGQEYQHTISKEQERLGLFLAGLDVDLIIGHHPHVVQPYSYLEQPDGGKTLCFYSLGNFLSAQDASATQLGALAYVRLKKLDTVLSIEEEGIIPTVNHYEQNYIGFRVYPLSLYNEELAKKHLLRLAGKDISVPWFTSLTENIFSQGNILFKNPFAGAQLEK
ncbi:MAG: CapA family protein [Treponema sp.]|jgi:poly-gamma-glutamate synthesis protein (capsule biosynthesis protein)|nr:CapA family protein [Treponema sp.]